jgi:hypothetical protein
MSNLITNKLRELEENQPQPQPRASGGMSMDILKKYAPWALLIIIALIILYISNCITLGQTEPTGTDYNLQMLDLAVSSINSQQ